MAGQAGGGGRAVARARVVPRVCVRGWRGDVRARILSLRSTTQPHGTPHISPRVSFDSRT